ncbi:helicase HerA domain-containing protein [Sphaerimonospora sp. CA-214678]|uniref:ATP-binding protein n=1 Tax=Sphaerimonospora sp. CA-214678 TaxID=3240029 RepID=UPI003D8A7B10
MMTDGKLKALAALRFNYAQSAADVWHPLPFHVEGLHRRTAQVILAGLIEAEESTEASPIGTVLAGQQGAGKTHLLGWIRQKVHEEDGYFLLVSLLDARGFWESVLLSMLDSLSRPMPRAETQLGELLWRLCVLAEVPRQIRPSLMGDAPLSREHVDAFVRALRGYDRKVGRETQDTARALVLRAACDLAAQDVGDAYLTSAPEGEPGERAHWGFSTITKSPQEIVRDLSRLLALTGPSVIAVDQIDVLLAQSAITMTAERDDSWQQALILEQIAGGLMALREQTARTLIVLSCLPASWTVIKSQATATVRDRFKETMPLGTIPDAETGRSLIEKRLAAQYGKAGFEPPYPTWPVKPEAFANAYEYTPRQLLIRVDEHVRSCLANGRVTELARLNDTEPVKAGPVIDLPPVDKLDELDRRFAESRKRADVAAALDPATEDAVMPGLLSAGLTAWIAEQDEDRRVFSLDPPPSAKPPLHARLRRSLDEAREDEAHWCFRAISATHHLAALTRLRNASVAAGLDAAVPKRRLFVLRNRSWARGPVTQETLAAFEQAGGRVLPIDEEDLKIFAALRDLQAENPPNLQAWLTARRPTNEAKLFREALSDASAVPGARPALDGVRSPTAGVRHMPQDVPPSNDTGTGSSTGPGHRVESRPARAGTSDVVAPPAAPSTGGDLLADPVADPVRTRPRITVGARFADGEPVTVELAALSKHTAIFAGSGSGKTVLIRRLVEECTLRGVSAIVLDPNNDLARLGDRWPEPPLAWSEGDAAKAGAYLANTEVVIWTPGRVGGRPLSFQPLPDFASVLDDTDEFNEAVETAVASLIPRAKLEGTSRKAHLGRAVLREAVNFYGRRGRTGLRGLIDLLSELPEDVSSIEGSDKIAAELAQDLTAAMVNDPLFGGSGTPVDPGLLLTPAAGKRARVSVISFVGLPSDVQRQGFVNQLQMALFSWIKRHPSADLGGLFVMDEAQTFAPSGATTVCTRSTLALAAQARKYGLGLVFATQAPKGLHNQIPGNATTQFFGLLNAPSQITAARELARAKGGDVPDVSRLRSGEFYVAVEGATFRKVRTPLCLSHHPGSPLTTEEVITRANRT